ncbi:MAG: hypothetical protein MRY21_04870 [Simkaniaceae bacterium]|nr:hypothetical protein [Simkaniaceae bacterium]
MDNPATAVGLQRPQSTPLPATSTQAPGVSRTMSDLLFPKAAAAPTPIRTPETPVSIAQERVVNLGPKVHSKINAGLALPLERVNPKETTIAGTFHNVMNKMRREGTNSTHPLASRALSALTNMANAIGSLAVMVSAVAELVILSIGGFIVKHAMSHVDTNNNDADFGKVKAHFQSLAKIIALSAANFGYAIAGSVSSLVSPFRYGTAPSVVPKQTEAYKMLSETSSYTSTDAEGLETPDHQGLSSPKPGRPTMGMGKTPTAGDVTPPTKGSPPGSPNGVGSSGFMSVPLTEVI